MELNEIDANEIVERDGLGTIQRIKSIEPIEGKDFVELVTFHSIGFKAVCEKIHSVGDLVLVVKYDSVVPELPMFEFMRPSKFRVKQKSFSTENSGKIYSQCIVLPLSSFSECILLPLSSLYPLQSLQEGQDLTSLLNIKKYIQPVRGSSSNFGKMNAKSTFPTHLCSKTDEQNCQSKPGMLNEINGLAYSITCKIDGSSMTCLINPETDEFEVCSRNNSIKEDETNSFWIVARRYKIEEVLRKHYELYNERLAIAGELCGQKIQANRMNISGLDFYIFNIIDLEFRKRVHFSAQLLFCQANGLKHVPVFERGESFDDTLDNLIDKASKLCYADFGFDSKYPIEGLVVRPVIDIPSRIMKGDTLSFKVMNPEYKN